MKTRHTIITIAAIILSGFSSFAMADTKKMNSDNSIPGILEFSWGIFWDCDKKPCIAHKGLNVVFYPFIVPKGITHLSPGRGISVGIQSFPISEFNRVTATAKGIPEAFTKHKERNFIVNAKLKFPEPIVSSQECDAWYYSTEKVIIVEIGKEAFVADYLPESCGGKIYDESFIVKPKKPGQVIALKQEMSVDSVDVVKLNPEKDILLKLETMGDGTKWIKANRLLHRGGQSDDTGYLYLPDVDLEPANY